MNATEVRHSIFAGLFMQRLNLIDGITQFVAGAGGRSHYEVDRGDPRD